MTETPKKRFIHIKEINFYYIAGHAMIVTVIV